MALPATQRYTIAMTDFGDVRSWIDMDEILQLLTLVPLCQTMPSYLQGFHF